MTSDRRTIRRLAGAGMLGAAVVLAWAGLVRADPIVATPHIHDIQGSGLTSPFDGRQVSQVPGIVTAITTDGFWAQDPQPDGSDATSEGIFVFTATAPAVTVGDQVQVYGTVNDFRPGGPGGPGLTRTEIDATSTTVGAHGLPLPPPVVIGTRGRRPPTDTIARGITFYRSLEGMRVAVDDAVAVGPRTPDGEVPVLADHGAQQGVRTSRGGIALQARTANPERIIIGGALAPIPAVNVGDVFPGRSTGILDYGSGNFKLLLTASPLVALGSPPRQYARIAAPGELSVATANLHGLDPSDSPAKFQGVALEIVGNLAAPDLVAVQEVEDNSGPQNDGTVAADQTVAQLIAAINSAGGPAYQWRSIDPQNNADGGAPGGNVRSGFLFRTDRGLSFVDRPGGDATTPVIAVDDGTGHARLSISPGRLDPANPAWTDSRKPLAGEFTWNGRRLIVIADHWNSKSGDDPLFSAKQPPRAQSEPQRIAEAQVVAGFVKSVQAIEKDALVIVAGDLNDVEYSPALKALTDGTGLRDLPAGLAVPDRYTYLYEGNSEVLDHLLLSPALTRVPYEYQIVHMNAEYADQVSDHDPSLVRLTLG